jgi:fructoselysine-6-P-deglycase FrlB-like protein
VSAQTFLAEIREQPEALRRLLERRSEFEAAAAALAGREVATIRLVGHGSSDAAASYGVYALGLLPGWTAFRDSISLSTYYEAKLDFSSSESCSFVTATVSAPRSRASST